MIELNRLTKRFGPVTAVDNLSVTVSPGRVTGFLGPNGAGKTNIGNRHFSTARLVVEAAVQPAAGLVRLQVQAGQDLPDLGNGDAGAASWPVISGCVHAETPSGGTEGAVATIASRTSGPYTSGRPGRGRSRRLGMPPRANRCRQVRTVVRAQPSSAAIRAFGQRWWARASRRVPT
jgi:hypothetical protein